MVTASSLLCVLLAGCGLCSAKRVAVTSHEFGQENASYSSAPLSFYTELAKLKVYGYQSMFCENSGTVKEDGKCATIDNYPSPNSHVEMRHAQVAEQLATVPDRQRKGEIIKGNDLGFFILNPYLWSNDGEYKTIGLGVSVEDHEFIRPIFDKVVGDKGYWNYEDIAVQARAYLDGKKFFDTAGDVMPFTTKLMHKIHLNMDLSDAEIADFMAFQGGVVPKIIMPDPVMMWGAALSGARTKRDEWLQKYMKAIEDDTRSAFPEGLSGKKPGGQLYKLAAGLMDSILFAGGLSVEGLIKVGMNALYSSHLPIETEFRPISEEDVEPFVYEVARLYPGVVGFPWWEPGYDGNKGGSHYTHRTVMNLALSLRDPRVFGDNFGKFVVRSLPMYKEKMGNAWAQPANEILEDKTLGKMSRGCPGQSLSVAIAKAFLSEFVAQQEQWAVTDGTKGGITWKDCTPFVGSFAKLARVPKRGVLTTRGVPAYYMFESHTSALRRYDSEADRVPDDAEAGDSTIIDLAKNTGLTLRSDYSVEKSTTNANCFLMKNKVPWGPWSGGSWEDDVEFCAGSETDLEEWYDALKGAPF